MSRKKVDWKIKNEIYHLGERTFLVGAINVTPDSVMDGGKYEDPDRAFVRAMELIDQGADFLEFGAESLRQGSKRVPEAEELRRLIPILKRLKGKVAIPIIVETYKPAVAEKAIEHGATVIKDSTGLTMEPDLAKVVMQHDVGFIMQHMRGTPETWAKLQSFKDPVGMIAAEMNAALNRAGRAGVLRERLVVDPGLGIGKRKEANTEILVGLDAFNQYHLPIQISPSGKPFNSAVAVDPSDTTTIAAATMAVLRGAHLIRVHDVALVRPAVLIADQAIQGE